MSEDLRKIQGMPFQIRPINQLGLPFCPGRGKVYAGAYELHVLIFGDTEIYLRI